MTTNLEVPLESYNLVPGWLEAVPQQTGGQANWAATVNTSMGSAYASWTPSNTYWYYYPSPIHRPIKLGLSEVEKLRSAAKRDAKLKKILEKFTDQIEVVVDFK